MNDDDFAVPSVQMDDIQIDSAAGLKECPSRKHDLGSGLWTVPVKSHRLAQLERTQPPDLRWAEADGRGTMGRSVRGIVRRRGCFLRIFVAAPPLVRTSAAVLVTFSLVIKSHKEIVWFLCLEAAHLDAGCLWRECVFKYQHGDLQGNATVVQGTVLLGVGFITWLAP